MSDPHPEAASSRSAHDLKVMLLLALFMGAFIAVALAVGGGVSD